ncbi:hypothetical protein VTI74DRAFT_6807 [Chaetomium olivicolor]
MSLPVLPLLLFVCLTAAQKTIDGEVVMDANFRWLHKVDSYLSCYSGNIWDGGVCSSNENCTIICALEGASYASAYGVQTANDSISLRLKTYLDFSYNVGSRLFLMESKNRYQMFTLMDNELAFDVDLSTVECGINSALYFVPMDPDGGQAKHPTNKAGAEYGTGYCDASCPRDLKFIAGKANMEGWVPSATDPVSGNGIFGACCPQFSVWNSNAHSFSMSSHTCPRDSLYICDPRHCDYNNIDPENRGRRLCDRWGCGYNPYRMGNRDFYGKGKKVDTARKFTVVTQWSDTNVTQFFVQDGKRIDMPPPVWERLPQDAGLSAEMCSKQVTVFGERDQVADNGGWEAHNRQLLNTPMVMVMSIGTDHYAWNTWLDSVFPPDDPGFPGRERGDCLPYEDNEPLQAEARYPKATVIWSNIRFGPLGSTVTA